MACDEPLVSVVIPTYNRSSLLLKAISSVFEQTYTNFEILIIDDCSTDNTQLLVNKISDNRIRYIKLEYNQGAPAARNRGIKESKGEYIAFLDSDDQWHPTKIQKQLKIFNAKKESDLGVVYTGIKRINGDIENNIIPNLKGNIKNKILTMNYVGTTSTVMVKRELLIKLDGFDLSLPSCQDWDLWIRLSEITTFDLVSEPLVYYYQHDGDRISTNGKSVVEGHLYIFNHYKEHVKVLPKIHVRNHNFNIGKIVIKAGILSQNKDFMKIGRRIIMENIMVSPFYIKNIILYLGSYFDEKLLFKMYMIFKRFKKS